MSHDSPLAQFNPYTRTVAIYEVAPDDDFRALPNRDLKFLAR